MRKMYPARPKEVPTLQGKALRNIIFYFCVFNIIIWAISLAFVGFEAMMLSGVTLAFAYSAWLTLREWVIILYILICIMIVFE
jgi:hypothetical protein